MHSHRGGIRAASRVNKKSARQVNGYGTGARPLWSRQALSAYTCSWMRTNRGAPAILYWLHRIGKSATAAYSCGHPVQHGNQITVSCPTHNQARRELIGRRTADTSNLEDESLLIRIPGEEGTTTVHRSFLRTYFYSSFHK